MYPILRKFILLDGNSLFYGDSSYCAAMALTGHRIKMNQSQRSKRILKFATDQKYQQLDDSMTNLIEIDDFKKLSAIFQL